VQYLVFGASFCFFVTFLLNSQESATGKFSTLIKKKGVFIFLFVLIFTSNFLARRYDVIYDLSQYRAYELREQTTRWLGQIDAPIEIVIFLQSDDKSYAFAEWLQTQINKYTPHIKIGVKNINKEVLLTQKYDVRKSGQTVLVSGDNWIKVEDFKESTLLPGLMRLVARTRLPLCFLSGHGEPDIEDTTEKGFGTFKEDLLSLGYLLKTVSLDQEDAASLEKKCGVLIVISPKGAFLPTEETRLHAIFNNMLLPLFLALDVDSPTALVQALAKEGVTLKSDLVVDQANLLRRSPLTDLVLYSSAQVYPLVPDLSGKIYLPKSQTITLDDQQNQKPNLKWDDFLTTGISDTISLNEDKNQSGPFTVAAIAMNEQMQLKRVLLGTGQSFRDEALPFGENLRLTMTAINQLLGEDKMVWLNIRNKEEVYMTVSAREFFWVKNLAAYGFPGLVFGVTFLIWFLRRVRS
jgi:hypothetical protein